MSLIERALGKVQQQGRPLSAPRAPSTPAVPVPSGRELPSAGHKVSIDLHRLVKEGLLPPAHHAARIADEYRRIKRPLLDNAFGEQRATVPNGNLIAVTSALPNDGKTFTALNLALSIAAEATQVVVLVDGDVTRGCLSEGLQIKDRAGLLDVLADESLALTDVLVDSDVGSLKLLPVGRKKEAPGDLVGGKRLAALLADFAVHFPHCVVIFDSSPLLATNEAQVLAKLVGQIVLVVKADSTPVPAVEEALSHLDTSKSVNVVLNQAQALLGNDYSHGGYY
jgi:receptor protein-tyrosine kinase